MSWGGGTAAIRQGGGNRPDCHRRKGGAKYGGQVTFEGRLAGGRKKPLGHAVKVLYDPERPENAAIRGFGPLYFVPLVAGILGLAALAWAAALVWLISSEL